MTFQDNLRNHLQAQSDDISLPDREPGRAVARAHARRRNRRVACGVVAVLALGAGIGLPQLGGGAGDDPISTGYAEGAGLPLTGPLTLDWQTTDGGLSGLASSFQADDGTVYALSTGPGVRYQDHPDGDYPRALYRLQDDGTWEAVPLDGDRPDARDVSTDGSLLYAVSTGPDGSGGYAPQLSTSSDRGDSWSVEDIEAAAPPSDVIPWLKTSNLAIESAGDTTLAVVSTSFRPNGREVFPQLRDETVARMHQAVPREDGFALVDYTTAAAGAVPGAEQGATGTAPTTTVPTGTAPTTTVPPGTAPTTTVPPGATTTTIEATQVPPGVETTPVVPVEPTVVELVPWADLGVSGIEALATQHQVFRHTGDGWEPVESTGLDNVSGLTLTVSGGRFVATGFVPTDAVGGGHDVVLTSADGASWTQVSKPVAGQVLGVGSALVVLPYEPAPVVHVSPDGGATWSELDLAPFGVAAGQSISAADAGPLGLAFVTMPSLPDPSGSGDGATATATGPQLVVSGDLVDWTVTPLADIGGEAATVSGLTVGADRIVVSASPPRPGLSTPPESGPLPDLSAPLESVTLVGTPVREG